MLWTKKILVKTRCALSCKFRTKFCLVVHVQKGELATVGRACAGAERPQRDPGDHGGRVPGPFGAGARRRGGAAGAARRRPPGRRGGGGLRERLQLHRHRGRPRHRRKRARRPARSVTPHACTHTHKHTHAHTHTHTHTHTQRNLLLLKALLNDAKTCVTKNRLEVEAFSLSRG